jgi:glycosyltransferase involved in cell wall biosynthesis
MKIILANKFYYLKGGAERHLFDLQNLLEKNGHETVSFFMRDERNIQSEYSKYFVSCVDIEKPSLSIEGLKAAGRIIYSFEAREKIRKLVKKTRPNIAHIHNIYHQISPSILTVLKKEGMPIVMTVHDFKLMCPVYIFYTQGEVCERCKRYRYYNCILRKCAKNSYLASAVNAWEMYLHKFLKIYENNVDLFIAPSNFVKQKILEFGFVADKKIAVLPNFVDYQQFQPKYEVGNYILYFGRLSKEKGVHLLLEAVKNIGGIKLKIAGKGPQEGELKQFVAKYQLNNVEFLGYLSGDELQEAVQNSMFTVVPSVFYEPFGLVLIESYAMGKPVIASNRGAVSELVLEGETGYTFESENSKDLAAKIRLMWKNKDMIFKMGKNGRDFVEKNFGPDKYYNQLISLYKKVIGS